jgi:acetolactate synthase-1/2/3 large subunit
MFGEWRDLCEVWRDRYSGPCEQPQTSLPSTRGLVDELSRQSATDDVLVPSSSGASSEAFLQAFQVKRGHRVVNSPGLGAMGYGVPQAVGVALASGRRVVATDGDGGFPMNAQELEVARRLRLPVKFFVLDNGGYGSIRQTQDTHFGGRHVASDSDSGLTLPSASDLAQAYGIPSTVVSLSSELGEAVRFALAADGPFVCQVVVDPSERTLPRVASRTVGGRIVSGTLHDMLPHLPPDEQKAATPFVGRNPS